MGWGCCKQKVAKEVKYSDIVLKGKQGIHWTYRVLKKTPKDFYDISAKISNVCLRFIDAVEEVI